MSAATMAAKVEVLAAEVGPEVEECSAELAESPVAPLSTRRTP